MNPADPDVLSFDFFPGMFFQHSPRFTCGEIVDEPALNLGGITTPALKQIAKRFPETRAICQRYDWTLRASYVGIFTGPVLIVFSTPILGDTGIPPEARAVILIAGLALIGASLLLNKDTGAQLRNLVDTYNALANRAKTPR